MLGTLRTLTTACLLSLMLAPAAARDEKCLAAMQAGVQACTDDCVAKARAAVDPSMRDTIIGRACIKNCLKIQMFQGQSCS